MQTARKEVQIVSRRFRVAASKLYNCHFSDYEVTLDRLLSCIETEPLIWSHIERCINESGLTAEDAEKDIQAVKSGFGAVFDTYSKENDQAAFVYLVLKSVSDTSKDVVRDFGYGYAHSKHFQDWADAFTKRFVGALIDSINTYLEEQLIITDEYGGQTVQFEIRGDQAQVNYADHGARIEPSMMNATNDMANFNTAVDELMNMLKADLSASQYSEAEEFAAVIKEEAGKKSPRKGILRTSFDALKGIAGTANCAAAIITIEQALQPFIC